MQYLSDKRQTLQALHIAEHTEVLKKYGFCHLLALQCMKYAISFRFFEFYLLIVSNLFSLNLRLFDENKIVSHFHIIRVYFNIYKILLNHHFK